VQVARVRPSKYPPFIAKSSPESLLKIDEHGRSVLALALESGHSISPTTKSCYVSFKHREKQCIQKFVENNPTAVGLLDPVEELYPFQIAATTEDRIFEMNALNNEAYRPERLLWDRLSEDFHEEMKKEMKRESDLACLNTIYHLLRADPSNILPSNFDAGR